MCMFVLSLFNYVLMISLEMKMKQKGTTKNWIAVEGALFSTSNYDTSLAALNSKLASSAPRGCIYPTLQIQQQQQQQHHQQFQHHHQQVQQQQEQPRLMQQQSLQTPSDEKNVFAIYVSYYVKVKLSLSAMGGELSLKLPFVLGNIESTDDSSCCSGDKIVPPNHSNDLHLNDHQCLDDIRRPTYDKSESLSENKYEGNVHDLQLLSRNSSVNCKSIDYDDVIGAVTDMSINNEGIEFINQKFNEMNRRDSNRSTDSSTSDIDENEEAKQEISVIQAQVHCQKYLESDI